VKILITGNMGYIGPVLTAHLRARMPEARLIGYDAGFFAHCLTGAVQLPERLLSRQIFGDVRELPDDLLLDVDAVVQLAAISNDPMGVRFEQVTDEVNHRACVSIAERAVRAGVKRIVFASSCSMYGSSTGEPRRETDALDPLTAYARSKVATEQALSAMDPRSTTITCLRFATACGMSDRLRLDLVLNDFVASALATGEITVLSDGTPWRPLIEVRDVARAIEWALRRDPAEAGPCVSVNVGANHGNHQVRELAHAVAAAIPGTEVSINASAPPDRRSYRVDFSLFEQMAAGYTPRIDLEEAIEGLKRGLTRMGFRDADFRSSPFMRLKVLERHLAEARLDQDLRWAAKDH
jgi:nucleoside-diphosphate-sugar epimerase